MLLPSPTFITLTDLSEAMEILDTNIAEAGNSGLIKETVNIERRVLDWDEDFLEQMGTAEGDGAGKEEDGNGRSVDLVVVSDCTYNADSLPALIRTIRSAFTLTGASDGLGGLKVLVALKPRHASEEVFFSLMAEARFGVLGREVVELPDSARAARGEEGERVEIYGFGIK